MQVLKILHADAQALIRVGFRTILKDEGLNHYFEEVACSRSLHNKLKEATPDLLIIDHNQTGFFSINDIKTVRSQHPTIKVLVISSDNNQDRILEILGLGVGGFINRGSDQKEVLRAMQAINSGENFFSNDIVEVLLLKHQLPTNVNTVSNSLTPRETEISKLIVEGSTSKQIANTLFLSYHTVHTHRKNVMRKLGFKTVAELAVYCTKEGLV